ncbi:hypothetical protein GFL58_22935 [Rhizobium leguminosarum bv. viciae]|nr:hypothetical protein [Rhizobium leguminosarum bv. viciae]
MVTRGILLWLVGIPIPIIILLYFFSRHLKRTTATLISSASGVGRQPPKFAAASFVFLKSNSSGIAGIRCRHFRHFHCPDKIAGRRRMPLDLNFPEGVQIFDMAFAERVSMVLIPSGQVLKRA